MLPDAAFKSVAPADPTQLHFEQAVAQHQRGELDAAIASYREVLAAHPNHLLARYHLGVALALTLKWKPAPSCSR
ncbi:MAG: tetratricopeptide repeat protein [Candidatus Competibacteraceae bacterium]